MSYEVREYGQKPRAAVGPFRQCVCCGFQTVESASGLYLYYVSGGAVTWAQYQLDQAAASRIDPAAYFSMDYSQDPPAPPRCDCGSEAAGCGPGAHSSWCSVAEVRA